MMSAEVVEWCGFRLVSPDAPPSSHKTVDMVQDDQKRQRQLKLASRVREILNERAMRPGNGTKRKKAKQGSVQKIADDFDLERDTIQKLIAKAERGLARDPDAKIEDLLSDRRGKPIREKLTIDEQRTAIGLYLLKNLPRRLGDGSTQKVKDLRAVTSIAAVLDGLKKTFPRLADTDWFSWNCLHHFLKRKEAENPAVFKLARQGDQEFYNTYLPKMPNDVFYPNQRWQCDGRYLPIYIRHKGIVCTVVLVIFLDDFSGYIPAWFILPRKDIDGMGKPYLIDFKASDVCALLIEAFYRTNLRPECMYTDNGSQFLALDDVLDTLGLDPTIELVHTIPGKPQGRGKIEDALKQANRSIKKLGGGVLNEKDRACWTHARGQPDLLSLESLQKQIKEGIDLHNTRVTKQRPRSPYEIWREAAGPRLPAPPIRRWKDLLPGAAESRQSVFDDGIAYNVGTKKNQTDYYVPVDQSAQSKLRWAEAAAREAQILFQVHPMGVFGTRYYASLDGIYWEEVIHNKGIIKSAQQYNESRNSAYKQIKAALRQVTNDITALQTDAQGRLPHYNPLTEELDYDEPRPRVDNQPSGEIAPSEAGGQMRLDKPEAQVAFSQERDTISGAPPSPPGDGAVPVEETPQLPRDDAQAMRERMQRLRDQLLSSQSVTDGGMGMHGG